VQIISNVRLHGCILSRKTKRNSNPRMTQIPQRTELKRRVVNHGFFVFVPGH
jgi:hypothetical protein